MRNYKPDSEICKRRALIRGLEFVSRNDCRWLPSVAGFRRRRRRSVAGIWSYASVAWRSQRKPAPGTEREGRVKRKKTNHAVTFLLLLLLLLAFAAVIFFSILFACVVVVVVVVDFVRIAVIVIVVVFLFSILFACSHCLPCLSSIFNILVALAVVIVVVDFFFRFCLHLLLIFF